ncbi:GD19417 [Drosophila simulans]|uniref:GD19417 n=1 Tax=Drosophila simulans TaxID=7240 RepID=B4R106_DROSI|nr:GD19417 [Drosophila simulans]
MLIKYRNYSEAGIYYLADPLGQSISQSVLINTPSSHSNLCLAEKEDDFKLHLPLLVARRKKTPGGSRKKSFDHLEVSFTRSNRGNNLLTIDGKPFTLNRRIKDVCYWECVKLRCKYIKCSARVVTKSNRISALSGLHNHP